MDEQLQQQIVQLVQAAMQGDEQATQQIQQIMQAAQQGDQQAAQLAQMIQQVAQSMTQSAKLGAKLNYLRQLKGQCPEGYEMRYFKAGGAMGSKIVKECVKCQKQEAGGKAAPKNLVEAFKEERALKKKAQSSKIKKSQGGNKMKPTKQEKRVTLKREIRTGEPYEEVITRFWSDGTKSRKEISEGGTAYTGRRGEVGITNVPNLRQNALADSIEGDFRGNTVQPLNFLKRK